LRKKMVLFSAASVISRRPVKPRLYSAANIRDIELRSPDSSTRSMHRQTYDSPREAVRKNDGEK